MSVPALTREQEDEVLKRINYSRTKLEEDTAFLRGWLNEQEHYPESRKTECDAFLVHFLVGCKGRIEKTQKKLDKYYSLRGQSDLFSNRDTFDYLDQASTFMHHAIMPKMLPDGTRVSIMRMYDNQMDKFKPLNALKSVLLFLEFTLRQGSGITSGHIIIGDAGGASLMHSTRLNPFHFRTFSIFVQEVCPLRVTKFIIFNANTIIDNLCNWVILPFVKAKLRERVVITSESDLSKLIEKFDVLPICYGGKEVELKCLSDALVVKIKETMVDILPTLKETVHGVERSTTIEPEENPYFGTYGTVKTLEVD